MVRDFNSKSSVQRGKTTKKVAHKTTRKPASGKQSTRSSVKVKEVATASRVKKVGTRVTRKPAKKPSGFLNSLFYTERSANRIDYTFLLLVVVMVAFGLVMLLSASTPTANVRHGNSYHFFLKQLLFVVIGAGLMVGISLIDYRNLRPYTRFLMIFSAVLLALVFVPVIGVSHNGSKRWINLIFFEFQPSELMKIALILYFAARIDSKTWNPANKDGFMKYLFWIGVVAILLLCEMHLSATIVICGIALCILLAGGANAGLILGGGAAAGAGLIGVIAAIDPVRLSRLTNIDPFRDMQAAGYQTAQAIYAIGSGGIFGKGLGESVQKYSYLPEPYNDFIFAVVCEELGLIGAIFLIGLFIALILRGLKIALEAEDTFGTLIVVGIMAQIAIQTVFNIGVATATIPNTGVSLPFFSYGGTAILMLLVEMGIILSVSRYSSKKK